MNKTVKTFISIALIICALMSASSCNFSGSDASNVDKPDVNTIVHSVTPTPSGGTNSNNESETVKPSTPSNPSNSSDNTNNEAQSKETYTLANPNTVLLDEKGVKLTALDFSKQADDTYVTVNVQIENKNDHDVNVMLNSLTVNGYIISGSLVSFVTKAGANQTVPLNISKRDLDFAEIDVIREIMVSVYAKDADYKAFISATEPVSLKTTKFDTPAKELNTKGTQVYNSNDILIVVKDGLESDSRYTFVKLLIQNSGDFGIFVSCDKLVVNGKELANFNCIRYGRVGAGMISYNSMDILKSELESLGIEKIETVEMTLKVMTFDYSIIAENLTVSVEYK